MLHDCDCVLLVFFSDFVKMKKVKLRRASFEEHEEI